MLHRGIQRVMSHYIVHVKLVYTVEETCRLGSLSRAQLYRLIDSGEIATVKIGKTRRITSRALDAFVRALELQNGIVRF